MWGRQELRGAPTEIYRATQRVKISIWAVKEVSENRTGSMVFLSESPEKCSPHQGAPLQVGTVIEKNLAMGEVIYGFTEDIGLIGYTIEPI